MNKNTGTLAILMMVTALTFAACSKSENESGSETDAAQGAVSAPERIRQTNTIKCGYVESDVLYRVDPDSKKLTGFYKEIADTLFAVPKWKVEYIRVVEGHEIEDLDSGKVEAICGVTPWHTTTPPDVLSTNPVALATTYVYARPDEMRFAAPVQMNKSDIVFIGILYGMTADAAKSEFPLAQIHYMQNGTTLEQMYKAVVTRDVDAIVSDPISVAAFNRLNESKLQALFPNHPSALYNMEFWVGKSQTELQKSLNGFIDGAVKSGLINTILKKYDSNGTIFVPMASDNVAQPETTPDAAE